MNVLAWLSVISLSYNLNHGSPISKDEDGNYVNEWAVHIPGGLVIARNVAQELGYDFGGQVSSIVNYFIKYQTEVRVIVFPQITC